MKVYLLDNDVNRYQYFLVEDESLVRPFVMDCTSRKDDWEPPEVFIYMPRLKAGVFYDFGADAPIFSPSATELLRPYLEAAGELLPLPYNGETYTVLNILNCVDCLDEERTEWVMYPSGERARPGRYVFHVEKLPETEIFKIPQLQRTATLVVERDPDTGLLADLRRLGIKGYTLKLLWDSEAE